MNGMEKIRSQFPQYDDLPDDVVARGVHQKYYADIPFRQFADQVGLDPSIRGQSREEAEAYLRNVLQREGVQSIGQLPREQQTPIMQYLNDNRADINSSNPLMSVGKITGNEMARMEGEAIAETGRDNPGILGRAAMVGQGQTLGWMDEIAGGVQGAVEGVTAPFRGENPVQAAQEGYNRSQAMMNRYAQNFRQDRPMEALGLEVGGGFATAGGAVANAPKAVRGAMASRPMLAAAATGAGAGALQGAGIAEQGERAGGAAMGGALGAALGPALQKVVSPAAGFIARQADKVNVPAPVQRIAQRMNIRSADIEALPAEGQGQNFLAEALGPDARQVAIGLAGAGGDAEDIAMRAIGNRQAGRLGRVHDGTAAAAGGRGGVQQIRAMEEARQAAKPLFDQADNEMVEISGDMRAMLRRMNRSGVSFDDADILAGATGAARERLSTLVDDILPTPASVRLGDLRALAMAAEDAASSAFRNGRGQIGKEISDQARKLRGALKEQSPTFRQASQIWSSEARNAEAYDLGERLFQQGASVQKQLEDFAAGDMAQAERAAFLAGITEAIERKIGGVAEGTGNAASRLKSDFIRNRIRTVLGEDASEEYIRLMDIENRMASFENLANREVGSATEGRQASRNALARVTAGPGRRLAAGMARDMRGTVLQGPRNALADAIMGRNDELMAELATGLYGAAARSNPLATALLTAARRTENRNALSAAGGAIAGTNANTIMNTPPPSSSRMPYMAKTERY